MALRFLGMSNNHSYTRKRKPLPRYFFTLACLILLQPAIAQQKESRAVYFDYDSYQLQAGAQKALGAMVAFCLSQRKIKRIEINGFADTSGNSTYNLELSEQRAQAVRQYLISHGLQSQSPKMLVNFYGENKAKGKSVEEQRAVTVNIYFALPDRDTVLRFGCVSVKIKANSFSNFNVNELDLRVTYAGDALSARENNLVMQDENGNTLLSNGMVKIDVQYRGKPINAEQPVEVSMPEINSRGEFAVYSGYRENGVIKWRLTDEKIERTQNDNVGLGCGSFYTFQTREVNSWKNIDKVDRCVCSPDGFGGMSAPGDDDDNALKGARGSLVISKKATDNRRFQGESRFEMRDLLSEDEMMDYCKKLQFPTFMSMPQYQKSEIEPLYFFEMKKVGENGADHFSAERNAHFLAVPKSVIGEGEGIRLITADKKDGEFSKWNSQLYEPKKCMGFISCDYVMFDAPLNGIYALVSVKEKKRENKLRYYKELEKEKNPVSVKVKKRTGAVVVFAKPRGQEILQTEAQQSDKHSICNTNKSDATVLKENLIVVKLKDGKDVYGFIKKADEVKYRKGKKQFVVRKLKKYTESEWEALVKKNCGG